MTKENSDKRRGMSDSDPEKQVPLPRRAATELIGTFMLVFAAAGADVAGTLDGEIGKFAVVAAPGLCPCSNDLRYR